MDIVAGIAIGVPLALVAAVVGGHFLRKVMEQWQAIAKGRKMSVEGKERGSAGRLLLRVYVWYVCAVARPFFQSVGELYFLLPIY